MTRRVGGVWPRVVAFENLLLAAHRAARGKRRKAAVAAFLGRLEPRLLALQAALVEKRYRPGEATRFIIYDPKEREITVMPFADRVVHHALIDVLEPTFDRRMIAHSYACRRGKGTHAALDYAQQCVRRSGWFLKLDILHCFASLQHEVVFETLARILKDRDVLDLFHTVICHPRHTTEGQGLPIGALTSQWLCNLVLGRLDHFVLQTLGVPRYLRYMDDIVLLSNSRSELKRAWEDVDQFVRNELRLSLKERASILAPTRDGLPFLGWRLYPCLRRLRPENRKRSYRRLKKRLWEHQKGLIDERQLADSTRSIMAHLETGTTHGLRTRWGKTLAARAPPA